MRKIGRKCGKENTFSISPSLLLLRASRAAVTKHGIIGTHLVLSPSPKIQRLIPFTDRKDRKATTLSQSDLIQNVAADVMHLPAVKNLLHLTNHFQNSQISIPCIQAQPISTPNTSTHSFRRQTLGRIGNRNRLG